MAGLIDIPNPGHIVSDKLREEITGLLEQIREQLNEPNGYPFNPHRLRFLLLDVADGRFRHSQAGEHPLDIDWSLTYMLLGMETELNDFLSSHPNPKIADPNVWALPVIRGVTLEKVTGVFRELGISVNAHISDLTNGVPTNDRDPVMDDSYDVCFRRTVEADPENANQSAEDRTQKAVIGNTLLERHLLGLGFYLSTGRFLDPKSATLCSGSRYLGGGVPTMNWDQRTHEIRIGFCGAGGKGPNLRPRAVISWRALPFLSLSPI